MKKSHKSKLLLQFIVDWKNVKDVTLNESEVDYSLNDYNTEAQLFI